MQILGGSAQGIFTMRIVMIGFPGVEYTIELSEALAELEDVLLLLPGPHSLRFQDVIKNYTRVVIFFWDFIPMLPYIFR